MRSTRRPAVLLLILSACLVAAAPATSPSSPSAPPAVDRGRRVRDVLLRLLEQSYADGSDWPRDAAASVPAGMTYTPPARDLSPDERHAGTTVVLHESLADHPDGVWVGYADGHLEFAPDAATLAACEDQDRLRRNTPKPADVVRVSGPAVGRLRLTVVDPDGRPVPGALVGVFGAFGDLMAKYPRAYFDTVAANGREEMKALVTDEGGHVVVPAASVFAASSRFEDRAVAPLYVLHEGHGLAALEEVRRSDFAAGASREIRLRPACKVTGSVSSLGLMEAGLAVRGVVAYAVKPYGFPLNCSLQSTSRTPSFAFRLPPGDYELLVHAAECYAINRWVHIPEGQRELRLYPDFQPTASRLLVGRPAPEFQQIKGWKNTPPLTLAGLRGHVVLLDFWGYWCGSCVSAMPEFMKLYDAYKDRGLVIVAVHDDSVESVAEMDQNLAGIRGKVWGGRDLPFPVALDGGGETRMRYSAIRDRGATTAAYGITNFPTTLLVGRDGTLLGDFDPGDPKDLARLENLLNAK